eukprot:6796939-Prymnesium_polylepis.1
MIASRSLRHSGARRLGTSCCFSGMVKRRGGICSDRGIFQSRPLAERNCVGFRGSPPEERVRAAQMSRRRWAGLSAPERSPGRRWRRHGLAPVSHATRCRRTYWPHSVETPPFRAWAPAA